MRALALRQRDYVVVGEAVEGVCIGRQACFDGSQRCDGNSIAPGGEKLIGVKEGAGDTAQVHYNH